MEHTKEQILRWQAQLAQDAKQSPPIETPEGPLFNTGSHLAIRGAILTDLRRMIEEVSEIVYLTGSRPVNEQAED